MSDSNNQELQKTPVKIIMADSGNAARQETVSLLDLLIVIVKNIRFIIGMTILGAVAAVGFSMYTLMMPADSPWNPLPNFYKPKVAVLLQNSQSSSLASSLTGELGLLAGLANLGAGSNSNAELAQWLLKGNTLVDEVITDFNLMEKFNETKFPRSAARQSLLDQLTTEFDSGTGILTITFEHIDPVFGTEVVNSFLNHLETRFLTLTMEKTGTKRIFLEQQLIKAETDLRSAQDTIIEFQKKYGIIDLTAQAESTLKREAELKSSIMTKELELQNLLQYLRDDDPQVVRLRNEIQVSKRLQNEFETGFKDFSVEKISQNQLPEISARFLNLKKELTIQETIYSTLRQQYETVKIDEADTSRKFQIVERAEVPEMKAGPGRGMLCVIVTMSVFMLSIMFAFIREYFSRIRNDPEESMKLRSISSMVRRKNY